MNNPETLKIEKDKPINSSVKSFAKLEKKKISAYKLTSDKTIETILRFDLNRCCYCAKVFLNPKFLINHALRRHSDNLKITHQTTEYNCNAVNFLSNKDLMQFIICNLSKFQTELENLKLLICKQTCQCNVFHNIFTNLNSGTLQSQLKGETVSVPEEMYDLKSRLSKMEEDILYLNENFNRINALQKISEERILDETEVYNRLKKSLLFELQPTIIGNFENNFKKYFLDFRTEIERLRGFIKENSEKIDSIYQSVSLEVKKEFENEIFVFLNSIKDGKSIKSQKDIIQFSQKSFNVAQASKKKKRHKNKLSLSKQCHINKVQNLNLENFEFCLGEKLKVLSISTGVERLSTLDFDTKMRLIQAEEEILNKKYKYFSKIRNYLDSYSEELVLSKLNDKKSRKLRFLLTNTSKPNTENEFVASDSSLDICSAVYFVTKKKKNYNSSASLKLCDYQNKYKLSDTSYNLAEELSPVNVFES